MYMFDPDSNLYVNSRDQDEFLRYDERTGVFLDTILSRGSGAIEILRRLMHILYLIQLGWRRQSPDVPRAD
jgi:hypothetical protein